MNNRLALTEARLRALRQRELESAAARGEHSWASQINAKSLGQAADRIRAASKPDRPGTFGEAAQGARWPARLVRRAIVAGRRLWAASGRPLVVAGIVLGVIVGGYPLVRSIVEDWFASPTRAQGEPTLAVRPGALQTTPPRPSLQAARDMRAWVRIERAADTAAALEASRLELKAAVPQGGPGVEISERMPPDEAPGDPGVQAVAVPASVQTPPPVEPRTVAAAPRRAKADPIGDLLLSAISGALPGEPEFKLKATLYHAGAKGVGALDALGCKVIAMRTAAIDGQHVPRRSVLFIKETVGLPMPDGTKHDGYWYAANSGGAIKGQRIDLFTGGAADSSLRNLDKLSVTKVGEFKGCPPA